MTKTSGGVPMVPYNRFIHDFINLDPSKHARSTFRFYMFLTCAVGGFIFAGFTVDQRQVKNTWYNRPDLKPFPAMVPKECLDETEQTTLEAHYQKFRNEQNKETRKKSAWYRLFFPNKADYSVNRNIYAYENKENLYNPANGFVGSIHNHYRDHHQE